MTQNELKDLIKISGLTVKAFAFEIVVKERTIYNYLSGKTIPMTVVILIRKTFYKTIDFKQVSYVQKLKPCAQMDV